MTIKRKPTKLQAAKRRAMMRSAKSKNRKPSDIKFSDFGNLWDGFGPGRPVLYSTPTQLWEAAKKFFQWCIEHPLYEEKCFAYKGKVITHASPKMRGLTVAGLATFLCINESTFHDYAKKSVEFSNVCTAIRTIMHEQKITGAMADLLNPSIVALETGLKKEADIEIDDGDVRITYTRARTPDAED